MKDIWYIPPCSAHVATGHGADRRVIARYPGCLYDLDTENFDWWLGNAHWLCDTNNRQVQKGKE